MNDASLGRQPDGTAARRIAASMLGNSHASQARIDLMPPGFSGASVFRLSEPNGRVFAIKRWPKPTSRQRIIDVHRVMRTAAQHCDFVPRIAHSLDRNVSCITDHESRQWDMCDWRPGHPWQPTDTTQAHSIDRNQALQDHVRAGGQAIAKLHQSIDSPSAAHSIADHTSLPSHQSTLANPAPAILERLHRWQHLCDRLPSVLDEADWSSFQRRYQETPALVATAKTARQCLRDHWARMTPPVLEDLRRWSRISVRLQVVLRDVHRDHVLFGDTSPSTSQPVVTGLIDFDAVRIDTPVTDLARWASSFTTTDGLEFRTLLHESAAGYQTVRPLSDQELCLAETIAKSSAWLTLANWLVWLVVEETQFLAGPHSVQKRMNWALWQANTFQIP